jgi:hypothetical protein
MRQRFMCSKLYKLEPLSPNNSYSLEAIPQYVQVYLNQFSCETPRC